MRNYEDLTPEEQAEFKEEIEKQVFAPLEKKGVGKKIVHQGKNVFKTPVNPMKIFALIGAAAKEKGHDPNSIVVNGQIVLFSMTVLLTMFMSVNEDGSEAEKKLDEYMKEIKAKEFVKVKGFISRLMNRLSSAYAAYKVFDVMMEQKAPNILGEDKAMANLKVLNDYNGFFNPVFRATNSYFLLELAKFFDNSNQALTLYKLRNCVEGDAKKLTAEKFIEVNKDRYAVESLAEAYKGMKSKELKEIDKNLEDEKVLISKLITYRDEFLAHDDVEKSTISITGEEVEKLFKLAENTLNAFADGMDFSEWQFDHLQESVADDTKLVIEHLGRFKPYLLQEIEAKHKAEMEKYKISLNY